MTLPRLLVRSLAGLGILLGAVLAVAGGLALRPVGLLAVGMTAAVTAVLAAGVARESAESDRKAPLTAAWQAAAWTVGVLLVLSGSAAIGGPLGTAVVVGVAATAALAVWLGRTARARTGRAPAGPPPGLALPLPPVSTLSTEALGREWTRTTAALAGRLAPDVRLWIVARRQATLDELERRDPDGVTRWLAGLPLPGSDPTADLKSDPAAG